ncbi:MAG: hypothetical protein GY846_20950 [Deltaproteobacteria bacterium]|nr:hypothetical protein [Deltaproteobacteria bacterium]
MRFGRNAGMLRVAQINSQITWGAGIGGHWGSNAVGASVTPVVHYSEAPTITYTPVTGSDYVNMWLSPISMQTLLVTINGGWDIETMFRVAVQRIGGLANGYSGSINQYKNPPQFDRWAHIGS